LRGRVLPSGGLREKRLAALRGGIKIVVIPKDNEKDLAEIPDNVKKSLTIMPVSGVDEVIQLSLVRQPEPVEWIDVEPAAVARSGGEGASDTTTSLPN
jgi:ATP-dependent Lon protease